MLDLYPFAKHLIYRLDPEKAHNLTIVALARGVVPGDNRPDQPILATRLWGRDFANPVGLAAGFDKDGEAVAGLFGLGFGFVEVGTTTPRPQPGNPQPRLFRLVEDEAVINRFGFNNQGHGAMAARLKALGKRRGLLGINLGKNKDATDAVADYVAGVEAFAALADYLVINVSSPNTPGLRALQGRAALTELLAAVLDARARQTRQPPLLLKIAPDLTEEDRKDVAEVALASGIDGLICGNTTLSRPLSLASAQRNETGGLSGKPLFALSTEVLRDMYRLTEGRLPLIGVGGIASGRDAYAKIRAGASAVQLYSALVYHGPALVRRVKDELAQMLRADGFASVAAAIGVDAGGR